MCIKSESGTSSTNLQVLNMNEKKVKANFLKYYPNVCESCRNNPIQYKKVEKDMGSLLIEGFNWLVAE